MKEPDGIGIDALREEVVVTNIIISAISEVIDHLADSMSERDREMLRATADEPESLSPVARVLLLLNSRKAIGVSASITDTINQVLQTLRQKLTPAEIRQFRTWDRDRNLLDEIGEPL